jgi:diadenosine tetraphosphate (Ap4A) HIT family hydrolase/5-methylcytosine-specific restriction endonuclease McrA
MAQRELLYGLSSLAACTSPIGVHAMSSEVFQRLQKFIREDMRMSHVYQPVMLQTLLERGGTATVSEVAAALLAEDRAQLAYYTEVVKRYPALVLAQHGVVRREKDHYLLNGYLELSSAEVGDLRRDCDEKVRVHLEGRDDPWKHRRRGGRPISGTIRYEVLKRASSRCELCGTSNEEKAIEVDHIEPKNHGGTDDIDNLQALCYSCNASKRDRDNTDFRDIRQLYDARNAECLFCNLTPARIVAENSLCIVTRDLYPVSDGHTLIMPRRHVGSYFELRQPEINSITALLKIQRKALLDEDASISSFNIGVNDGPTAGQTIPHCHIHLIPRRVGDIKDPRGGVRGVIPEKQKY